MMKVETALQKFSKRDLKVFTNSSAIFGVKTPDGTNKYKEFFATEAEAIAYCENPDNDQVVRGETIYPIYVEFAPGELLNREGQHGVYLAHDRSDPLESIGGKSSMPFVQWIEQKSYNLELA